MAAEASKTKKNSPKRSSSGRKGRRPAAEQAPAPEVKPKARSLAVNRTLWAVILLVLSILSFLALFSTEKSGYLVDQVRRLERGLVGAGWWTFGIAFLAASIMLMFKNGKPRRLRIFCTLTAPWLLGTLSHVVLHEEPLDYTAASVETLYNLGSWKFSGGVLGGSVAQLLVGSCGALGAVILLLLVLIGYVLILTRTHPRDVANSVEGAWDDLRENGQLRIPLFDRFFGGYDPEDDEIASQTFRGEVDPSELNHDPDEAIDSGDLGGDSLLRRARRALGGNDLDVPLDGETYIHSENRPAPMDASGDGDAGGDGGDGGDGDGLEGVFRKRGKKLFKSKNGKKPPVVEPVEEPSDEDFPEPLMKKEKFVADTQIQHDLVRASSSAIDNYQKPSYDLLKKPEKISNLGAGAETSETQGDLISTINSFGINGRIVGSTRGPSVTRYEFELERGTKLSKLTNLSRDIALSLGVFSVRIAPIVGKNSVVGIEVPNRLVAPVPIRSVLDSPDFENSKSSVSFAVGKDIANRNVIGDIARMPHLLIAGTTGSGKSVCTNSMIISLLYKSSPQDVRLIMVDPKMVELSNYNGIPHLLIPVVTDPKKAAGALQWAVFEMMQRYQDFANVGVRDIESFNARMRENPEMGEPKPKIVVFIDELADLMIAAAKEVEESICRVAQMGRAAGIHLVIATQRPSSDVITGLMKANIPSRIALAVASAVDSRIILDSSGAEDLVGNGDMLFAPLGKPKRRVQGCYISDEEVNNVIDEIKRSCGPAEYSQDVMNQVDENARRNEKGNKGGASAFNVAPPDNYGSTDPEDDRDPLFYDAVDVVVELQMASASTLQRKLKVGYARAARLVDQMEEYGYVGPFEGSKPRSVLVTKEKWAEKKMQLTGEQMSINTSDFTSPMAGSGSGEEMPPFDL